MPRLTDRRNDPVLEAIGQTIRGIRITKGVSQERLALLAEVDRSYVGRIERGENNIAVLTLVRIAAALEISVAEIMLDSKL